MKRGELGGVCAELERRSDAGLGVVVVLAS